MRRNIAIGTVTAGVIGAAASAGIFDPTMYSSDDPATYGTLLAELDIADTSFDFPFSGSFSSSGYVNEFNGIEFDRTELVSRVFEITAPVNLSDGSNMLSLSPGDRVFSYSIRLVESSSNTVSSLAEFQVGGVDFSGAMMGMDPSVVLGRGFVSTTVNTPVGGDSSDLSEIGPGASFGASLDYQWPTDASEQLTNDEMITLLMFTSATQFTEGTANFSAPPGQQSLGDPNVNGAPALVPVIPGPGAGAIAALAAGFVATRRRRSEGRSAS